MNKSYQNNVFPSLLNEIINTDRFGGLESIKGNYPAVNIIEKEKEFTLELNVPGRNKEDFTIEIDKNVLTVSSKLETKQAKETEKFSVKEFSHKSFERTFGLPKTVNEEEIKADYVNGILSFTMPKKEEALPKPKRKLEVG